MLKRGIPCHERTLTDVENILRQNILKRLPKEFVRSIAVDAVLRNAYVWLFLPYDVRCKEELLNAVRPTVLLQTTWYKLENDEDKKKTDTRSTDTIFRIEFTNLGGESLAHIDIAGRKAEETGIERTVLAH